MTDSVTTHIDKGKTIDVSPPSPLPRSRGSKGVVISEPRPTASPGLSSGTRRPFTRQTVQVGDSVRSMLKRARAVVSEDAVDYNEAQQNNLAGHSVSVSNQRTHHSQLFLVEDFHEDSSALYVDAALDHKHGLTGIGFTFKIGHHQIVASENRLLPGDWQDHSALSGLVSQIRLFSFTFPEASLKYLPRQFNTAAHCLAKDAIRLREEGHEEFF
ncbi:hypothetical protein F8388_001416 [Cannabis sativa]|uniref:RNase H type-1 domain-containing protein n=1 Tax=Cannabis sativa TaxID=3483 RepID=A0A7J6GN27_CANSA|nr:hypothetical protein F8388_001416 [Cannabis sativa]